MFQSLATIGITILLVGSLVSCSCDRGESSEARLTISTYESHQVVPEMTDGIKCVSKLRFEYSRDQEVMCLAERQTATTRYTLDHHHWHRHCDQITARSRIGTGQRQTLGTMRHHRVDAVKSLFDDTYRAEVLAQSRCLERPVHHQMTHSPNDPDYGLSSKHYLDLCTDRRQYGRPHSEMAAQRSLNAAAIQAP